MYIKEFSFSPRVLFGVRVPAIIPITVASCASLSQQFGKFATILNLLHRDITVRNSCKMDLHSLQYQMLLAVKKHQLLMGKRKLEPENGSLKKEILDVLCQLIDINEKQKIVVAQLRAERQAVQPQQQQQQQQQHEENIASSRERHGTDLDLQCNEQMLQESAAPQDLSVTSLPRPIVTDIKAHNRTELTPPSLARCNGQSLVPSKPLGTSSPLYCNGGDNVSNSYMHNTERKQERLLELQEFRNQNRKVSPVSSSPLYLEQKGEGPQISQSCHSELDYLQEDLSPTGGNWCSPEKRLNHFSPPPADYTSEDVHDLVTAEEFMNAIGLLTVRECDEVTRKRYERRKRNQNRHIFSLILWEKPERRRKRRDWLAAAVGSPPNLRNKPRPFNMAPKGLQSGPSSPLQSSCSPPASHISSQPPSPASTEHDTPTPTPPISEEICPVCKLKGADVLCEGCGVVYHGPCVELGSSCAPPGWLCLTCEQLGLRASSSCSLSTPQHLSSRREMLIQREQLLHQRASLTITKLQLEERKMYLSKALEIQTKERENFENRECDVREAIHRLKTFIANFQKSPPPSPIQTPTSSSPAQSHTVTLSKTSSSSSALCCDNSTPPTLSQQLYPATSNTPVHYTQQKPFYIASNSCSISSASFPTSTKVVSSPSLLHCSTFSSFPATTTASSYRTSTSAVSPLLSSPSSSRFSPSPSQRAYSPTAVVHPRPASPSIGHASYPCGSPSPWPGSYSQRSPSHGPASYPHNFSPDPAPYPCPSPSPGPTSAYTHRSPSPDHAHSYSQSSSSLGHAIYPRGSPSIVPASFDPCTSSPDPASYPTGSPVTHLRCGSSSSPTASGSTNGGVKCHSNTIHYQSNKFPSKRKHGISDSVFHNHKNGLATRRRNESDAMRASS